jgi:helix-turn-helix protein
MAPEGTEPSTTMDLARRARALWRLLEPIHAVVYFAPDARARFEAVGLKGYWMGYFASRAAALGPVGPDVVTAAFYVFHPAMVARALPDAWDHATPSDVLAARLALAGDTLRGALGDAGDSGDADDLLAADRLAPVADVVAGLAERAPRAGRPLGAAHAALPAPDDPLLRLWWAATVLREHRGDGHVAALLTAGIDPCEALVVAAASGAVGPDGARILQDSRKWPDEEWAAATDRVRARGWLDDDGALSPLGREARRGIEHLTDQTASATLAGLGAAELDALEAALAPITAAVVAAGAIPRVTPIGLDAFSPPKSGS